MSNISDRGDSQTNIEKIVTKDSDFEPNHQDIVRNIFATCDTRECGFVAVSQIIKFISPYMNKNTVRLKELHDFMDPQGQDPLITERVLINAMEEWRNKPISESETTECTETIVKMAKSPILSDLNLSNISNYSSTPSVNGQIDVSALQEEINELHHHNKKMNDNLIDVRNQLVAMEEHNSHLQSELDRLNKKLQHEQKSNEMYQKERKEYEEYRENIDKALKKYESVNQVLTLLKKENKQLKGFKDTAESQKMELEEKITQLKKRESAGAPKVEKLQKELYLKNKEISALQDTNRELEEKNHNLQTEVQEYKDKVQVLKEDKKDLEKQLSLALKNTHFNMSLQGLDNQNIVASTPKKGAMGAVSKGAVRVEAMRRASISSLEWLTLADESALSAGADNLTSTTFHTLADSLHNEIMQARSPTPQPAPKTGPCCDDKLKLIQYEHKIKFLEQNFKDQQKLFAEYDKKQNLITELQENISNIITERDKLKKDLSSIQKKNSKLEQLLHRTKETLSEFEELKNKHEEEINLLKNKENKLVEDIKKHKQNQEDFLERCKKLNKNIESLKSDATKFQIEKETAVNELTKVKKDNLNLHDSLRNANSKIEQLLMDSEQMEKDLKEKDSSVTKINRLYQESQQENERLRSTIVDKETDIMRKVYSREELEKQVNKLQKEKDKKDSLLSTKDQQYNEITKILSETKIKLTNTEKLLEEKSKMNNKEIITLHERISTYEMDYSKLTKDNEHLHKELKQLQNSLNENNAKLAEKDEIIAKLDKEINNMQTKIKQNKQEIKDELSNAKTKISELEQEISDKNKIIEQANAELAKVAQDINSKTKYAREIELTNNNLQNDLKMLVSEVNNKEKLIDKLSSDFQKSSLVLSEKDSNINQLNKLNENLNQELKEARKKYKDYETKLIEKGKIIEEMTKELTSISLKISETEMELTQTRLDLLNKESDLINKNKSYHELSDEFAKVKMELSDKDNLLLKRNKSYEHINTELEQIRSEMLELKTKESHKDDKSRKLERFSRRDILQHKLDKLDELLSDERLKTKHLEAQLAEITKVKGGFEKTIKSLNEKVNTFVQENESLSSSNQKLKTEIEQLESKLLSKVKSISNLHDSISQNEKTVEVLEEKLSISEDSLSKLESILMDVLNCIQEEIVNIKHKLESVTLACAQAWKRELEQHCADTVLSDVSCVCAKMKHDVSRKLVAEIAKFRHQVACTATLLKALADIKNEILPEDSGSVVRKQLKLRRPVLLLCSRSEDQPEAESPPDDTDQLSQRLATLEINNNSPAISPQHKKPQDFSPSRPDNQPVKVFEEPNLDKTMDRVIPSVDQSLGECSLFIDPQQGDTLHIFNSYSDSNKSTSNRSGYGYKLDKGSGVKDEIIKTDVSVEESLLEKTQKKPKTTFSYLEKQDVVENNDSSFVPSKVEKSSATEERGPYRSQWPVWRTSSQPKINHQSVLRSPHVSDTDTSRNVKFLSQPSHTPPTSTTLSQGDHISETGGGSELDRLLAQRQLLDEDPLNADHLSLHTMLDDDNTRYLTWDRVCDWLNILSPCSEVWAMAGVACFVLCTVLLGGLLVELEYARRPTPSRGPAHTVPFRWASWDELLAPFLRTVHHGPPPI